MQKRALKKLQVAHVALAARVAALETTAQMSIAAANDRAAAQHRLAQDRRAQLEAALRSENAELKRRYEGLEQVVARRVDELETENERLRATLNEIGQINGDAATMRRIEQIIARGRAAIAATD